MSMTRKRLDGYIGKAVQVILYRDERILRGILRSTNEEEFISDPKFETFENNYFVEGYEDVIFKVSYVKRVKAIENPMEYIKAAEERKKQGTSANVVAALKKLNNFRDDIEEVERERDFYKKRCYELEKDVSRLRAQNLKLVQEKRRLKGEKRIL